MAGIGELEAQTLSTAIGRRALRAATALAAAGVVGLAALTGTADAEPRAAGRAEHFACCSPAPAGRGGPICAPRRRRARGGVPNRNSARRRSSPPEAS